MLPRGIYGFPPKGQSSIPESLAAVSNSGIGRSKVPFQSGCGQGAKRRPLRGRRPVPTALVEQIFRLTVFKEGTK